MPVRIRESVRFGQVTGAVGKLKPECCWEGTVNSLKLSSLDNFSRLHRTGSQLPGTWPSDD